MSKVREIKTKTNYKQYKKAVIYCRVSSERQKREGHGLDSQEQRCREYAKQKGYEVVAVFKDSFTGGGDYKKRPALSEMLELLSKEAHTNFVVIFDDLKRLARDFIYHWELRKHLSKLGARVESPNFDFDDEDDNLWMHEAISSVFNESERRTNRKQVIQKHKARLEQGFWAFGSKRGYEMIKSPIHGKILAPKEPDATYLRNAISRYASGEYVSKVDACRYLVEKGFWTTQKPEKYIDKFTDILINPIYAGYIEYPAWGVERRKGHHEGIITEEVFERVQKRLRKEDSGVRIRRDINPDFPLRGLLLCEECGKPLTGAFSGGRSKRYPYYFCQTVGCINKNKSIPKKNVEDRFSSLLTRQVVSKKTEELVQVIFEKTWEQEVGQVKKDEKKNEIRRTSIQSDIKKYAKLASSAAVEEVRKVYEEQIVDLSNELKSIESPASIDLSIPYRTALDKSTGLLKSPLKIWVSLDVVEQQRLFFFIFDQKLPYSIEEGYRTDKIPTAVRLFEEFVTANSQDVEMAGIEPASKEDS